MTMAGVPVLRTFHHADHERADLLAAKGSTTVSVCLPARDEAGTIGPIVGAIVDELVDGEGLVDEVLVVDDASEDGTAEVARDAGARVVATDDLPSSHEDGSPIGQGKGEALWRSLYVSEGDLVLWCDADIVDFDTRFVTGLLGPLLTSPEIGFVKGYYERPLAEGGVGGGRVTELVARPIVALLYPELVPVVQPLAGEYGGRRELLEQLPFVGGYGVDLALLIDVAQTFGVGSMAQVDLGTRVHRNRPLEELGPQALAVLQAALHRADPALVDHEVTLIRPGLTPHDHELVEHPALSSVDGYQRRTA